MSKGPHKLRVPNAHTAAPSVDLLKRLLGQAGVTREEWEAAAER